MRHCTSSAGNYYCWKNDLIDTDDSFSTGYYCDFATVTHGNGCAKDTYWSYENKEHKEVDYLLIYLFF